jgi:hypothetical protein
LQSGKEATILFVKPQISNSGQSVTPTRQREGPKVKKISKEGNGRDEGNIFIERIKKWSSMEKKV